MQPWRFLEYLTRLILENKAVLGYVSLFFESVQKVLVELSNLLKVISFGPLERFWIDPSPK